MVPGEDLSKLVVPDKPGQDGGGITVRIQIVSPPLIAVSLRLLSSSSLYKACPLRIQHLVYLPDESTWKAVIVSKLLKRPQSGNELPH